MPTTSMIPARAARPRLTALVAAALASLLLTALVPASALAEPERTGPVPTEPPEMDGRAGLAPGADDSTENLELRASLEKPEANEGANSDLAFAGDFAYMGNFDGFQIIDISDPTEPELVTAAVCPASQNDVSVSGDLLFVSVEAGGFEGCADGSGDSAVPFRGVRIFDVSDPRAPQTLAEVQTCRGSHTHSLLDDPSDDNLYVYVSGVITPRNDGADHGLTCSSGGPDDPDESRWRIDIIEVPRAAPREAALVSGPRIFAEEGRIDGLQQEPQDPVHPSLQPWLPTPETTSCHDITTYVEIGLAAGACEGNGILLDITDPVNPVRVAAAADPNYAYWHSATFNDDGTKVVFTDEWGGGILPHCTLTDRPEWGANSIYDIVETGDGVELQFASYYKIPNTQSDLENCVAHNGSLIPIPGRDIMVQAWYQGGISIFEFTDSANPVELAWFDRGPFRPGIDGPGDDEPLLTLAAGFWSAYWYEGHIFGSEIGRGFDVLELSADDQISEAELAAAQDFDQSNPQAQVRYGPEPGEAEDLIPACDRVTPRSFPDVSGPPHSANVECVAGYGIAQGRTDGTYRPLDGVRRDQMASFLVRTLQVSGVELPSDPPQAFDDIEGNTHELQIRQLAAVGVTQGRGDRRYDPHLIVPRGQMARFVVNALETVLDEQLEAPSAGYPDTAGTTHAEAIDVATDLGIVRGFADGSFRPTRQVRRDQMGTFLAGTLQAVLDVGGDRELTPQR